MYGCGTPGRRMTAEQFAASRWVVRLRTQGVRCEDGKWYFDSVSDRDWNAAVRAGAPLRFPVDGTFPQLFVTLSREPARRGDLVPRDVFYERDGKCVWIDPVTWCGGRWIERRAPSTVEYLRYDAYGLFEESAYFVSLGDATLAPNLENCVVRRTDDRDVESTQRSRMLRLLVRAQIPGILAPASYPDSTMETPETYGSVASTGVVMYRGEGWSLGFTSLPAAARHAFDYVSNSGKRSVADDTAELFAARLYFTLDDECSNYPYDDTYGYCVRNAAAPKPPTPPESWRNKRATPPAAYAPRSTCLLRRGVTWKREFTDVDAAAAYVRDSVRSSDGKPDAATPRVVTVAEVKRRLLAGGANRSANAFASTAGFYVDAT